MESGGGERWNEPLMIPDNIFRSSMVIEKMENPVSVIFWIRLVSAETTTLILLLHHHCSCLSHSWIYYLLVVILKCMFFSDFMGALGLVYWVKKRNLYH